MVRVHLERILSSVTSRQTDQFMEALNTLLQAATRKAVDNTG